MLLLGIDTSTPQVSVALGRGGVIMDEIRLSGGRRHAEQLAPAIRYLCVNAGVSFDQLAGIAVGIGPGLFTGLRVGVTTAKTMAQALQIPVVPIVSLDLVAYPLRHTERRIVAVIDARRHEVFHATYRPVPGGVERTSDYQVGSPGDLVADLEATTAPVLLAGDGVDRYGDEFAALDHAERAGPIYTYPSVAALLELATGRFVREELSDPFDVRPLYLRESDAELSWGTPR